MASITGSDLKQPVRGQRLEYDDAEDTFSWVDDYGCLRGRIPEGS